MRPWSLANKWPILFSCEFWILRNKNRATWDVWNNKIMCLWMSLETLESCRSSRSCNYSEIKLGNTIEAKCWTNTWICMYKWMPHFLLCKCSSFRTSKQASHAFSFIFYPLPLAKTPVWFWEHRDNLNWILNKHKYLKIHRKYNTNMIDGLA